MEKLKRLLTGEAVKYMAFGVITTAVNFVVYFAVTAVLGDDMYLAANVVAWMVAVAFAYITNKLWVFESRSWKRNIVLKELGTFVSARLFSLGVEELGLFVALDIMNIDSWALDIAGLSIGGGTLAKLSLQILIIVLNYIFSKLVIFRKQAG